MKVFFKFAVVAIMMAMTVNVNAQIKVITEERRVTPAKPTGIDQYRQAQTQFKNILAKGATIDDPEVWIVGAKVSFDLYEQLQMQEMLSGQKADIKEKGYALIDGCEYLSQAMKLDSLSGKHKFTKDYNKIKARIDGSLIDFKLTAMELFLAKDYAGAYRLFDFYCEYASPIESVDEVAEARYYQIFAAREIGDSENASFGNVVQKMISAKQYDLANALIDRALKDQPGETGFIGMKAFVVEMQKGADEALPLYKTIVEQNPDDANSLYNLGRAMYVKAIGIVDKNPDKSVEELAAQLKPIYDEALQYLNKAAALDPKNTQISRIIENINYVLGSINPNR